jgi:hypothetical protein
MLRDSTTPFEQRAEALRFLIHFVGDLHQPLHVTDNGDRGGNELQVTFLSRPTNLHHVWDQDLIEARGMSESEFTDRLEEELDSVDVHAIEQGTTADWALQAHELARKYAYGLLPASRSLDQSYVDATAGVVDISLIRGGMRLAKVLNEDLAAYRPSRAQAVSSGKNHVYADWQARAHAGERATVVGTVANVHETGRGTTYLNFGAPYPHQTFTGAVLRPGIATPGQLNSFAGKRVGVTGTITLHHGQAEIVIDSIGQLTTAP